ncbi:MAG: hypothetical protein ACLPY1_18240 [Terracidiphilus sp.]
MPFKIKDLMISDLSEGAHQLPYETCRPISEVCLPLASFAPCTLLTYPHWPTITCGACTVITRAWPTITCGACTPITRGAWDACTVVTNVPLNINPCTACTVVTRGECTNITCGDFTWEGTKAKDAGSSSAASFEALLILKEQLKQQLAEVEKEQAALEKCLLPQTVEQVDDLSKKLTEALQELKVLKQKLSSKPKPTGNK